MAPVLGLGLEALFDWLIIAAKIVGVGFVLVGVVMFLIHHKGGRSLRIPGVLSVGAGAGILFLLIHGVSSLETQASNVLILPKEATVTAVKTGDWAGDGSVSFTLPSKHSTKYWLDLIWKTNASERNHPVGAGIINPESDNERDFSSSERQATLKYDAASGTYSYNSQS